MILHKCKSIYNPNYNHRKMLKKLLLLVSFKGQECQLVTLGYPGLTYIFNC